MSFRAGVTARRAGVAAMTQPLTRLRHPLPASAGRGALDSMRSVESPSPRRAGRRCRRRMRGVSLEAPQSARNLGGGDIHPPRFLAVFAARNDRCNNDVVLSRELEIRQLREEGALPAEVADVMIAKERREVVSVYTEVRVLAWAGVMLIVTGVGIIVSKNLDRIGPIAIAAAIGIASAACYGYCVAQRRSAHRPLSDYILLLGALLLSADVGYIEHQFHLLGSEWPRHFLLLAVVHGATAYFFASRTLLSLSIAALASWFGFERNAGALFN